MKTKEQIRQEVIDYLTKTSKHTFTYENSKLFKVVSDNDKFYILDEESLYNMKEINFDSIISYYGPNSKNVIKHSLFLNKNLKSVKNSKFIKENIKTLCMQKNNI